MNKKKMLTLVLIFIFVGTIGNVYNMAVSIEAPNLDADTVKKEMGMNIAKCDIVPAISREQAVEAAKKAFPDLASSQNIKTQLNTITYNGFTAFSAEALDKNPKIKEKGYLDQIPVWIVSFKGLVLYENSLVNLGDKGNQKIIEKSNEEENVVVDAESGVVFYSFTFR
ncbi:MAG TPA: hypothetical protein VF941_22840 [Clostridia bacterium]